MNARAIDAEIRRCAKALRSSLLRVDMLVGNTPTTYDGWRAQETLASAWRLLIQYHPQTKGPVTRYGSGPS